MKVLGVHFHSHDTSVVLVDNGSVVYASSNERFSRKKMDSGVPLLALEDCFEYCKVKPKDLDIVSITGSGDMRMFWEFMKDSTLGVRLTGGKRLAMYKKPLNVLYQTIASLGVPSYLYRYFIPATRVRLALNGFEGKYEYVAHHFCHVAAAYHTSGWDKCLVGIVEGDGYDESTSVWHVENGKYERYCVTRLPHSAGRFYELITYILGFDRLKHPGKITGLAAYGDSSVCYGIIKNLLWVEGLELRMDYKRYYEWLSYYDNEKSLPKEIARYSREDLAAAFQFRLEECVVDIIGKVVKITGESKIALAGGVVANVKLNQRIFELDGVRQIHIQQAMGDAGLALGAALYSSYENGEKVNQPQTMYLGPDYADSEIEEILKQEGVNYERPRQLEARVARLLAEGSVVAWFDGRMEYGPRALGSRSILYQTTDKTVNDWLNKRLKRTEFMPFAPVTLEKYATKCYKNFKGAEYPARFMTITFDCTEYMKKTCPAVVHVDNTARPQVIRRKDNPRYYKVVEEYYKITGIPSIINTSFNMHGEPIVCTPSDAVRSFLQGNIDYMAIGSFLVSNEQNSKE